MSRARQWSVRCVHESQLHEENSFVTLTYSDEHIPEDWSVNVRDWQLFAKRLREAIGPFRFFMAAEYGGKTFRPHYHALIFGHAFLEDRVMLKAHPNRLWTSPVLEKKWGKGHVSLGDVTPETCSYVTKYCVKKQMPRHKLVERVDADTGECWSVRPEFQLMSRRPGLGAGWIDKYPSDVFPADEVVLGGSKMFPPRYYFDRFQDECVKANIKLKRKEAALERVADQTHERLAVRERVAVSRLTHLGR